MGRSGQRQRRRAGRHWPQGQTELFADFGLPLAGSWWPIALSFKLRDGTLTTPVLRCLGT